MYVRGRMSELIRLAWTRSGAATARRSFQRRCPRRSSEDFDTRHRVPRLCGGRARARPWDAIRTVAHTWLPLRLEKLGCSRTSTRDPPHGTRHGAKKRIQLRSPEATAYHAHVGGWGNTMHCSRMEEQGDEVSCVDAGVGGKQEYGAGTMDGWMVMKGKHGGCWSGIYFNRIERY